MTRLSIRFPASMMPTVDREPNDSSDDMVSVKTFSTGVCENCTISWATVMMVGKDARYDTAVMFDGCISLFGSDLGMRTSPRTDFALNYACVTARRPLGASCRRIECPFFAAKLLGGCVSL